MLRRRSKCALFVYVQAITVSQQGAKMGVNYGIDKVPEQIVVSLRNLLAH